ncbi:MAG: signal peptidase I [Euryarchaeota archaeon]|nr:signal peptidase I [Euryarchaeota archaeon]
MSTVFYAILGIVLGYLVLKGASFALNTSMPVVAVVSDSMVPTFSKGDLLFVKGVDSKALKEGDIIVFKVPLQTPVVHRLIRINGDGTFTTKGDANRDILPFERRIHKEQIIGKVISWGDRPIVVPKLGWVKIMFSGYR